MNLKEYNFIIVSGCSYDRFSTSFTNILSDTNIADFENFNNLSRHITKAYPQFKDIFDTSQLLKSKTILISLGIGGFSNEWVEKSLIYFLDFLKIQKIPISNIYVLASFTAFHRYSIEFNGKNFNYTPTEEELNLFRTRTTYFNDITIESEIEDMLQKAKIGKLFRNSGIGRIGDKLIIRGIVDNIQNKQKEVDSKAEYLEAIKELHKFSETITDQEFVNNSLSSIENLGTYLEDEGIAYNFCSMHSIFNYLNETVNRPAFLPSNLPTVYSPFLIEKHWERKTNTQAEFCVKEGMSLQTKFPEFKDRIDSVLKFNWSFFEADKITKGGIDEFIMYNYGTKGYGGTNRVMLDFCLPKPQNHPSSFLYPVIFNYFAKDCPYINSLEKYTETIDKFLEYFHNRKTFNLNNPVDNPIVPAFLFKDKIQEFTELNNLNTVTYGFKVPYI